MTTYEGWANWATWTANIYLTHSKEIHDEFFKCSSSEDIKALFIKAFKITKKLPGNRLEVNFTESCIDIYEIDFEELYESVKAHQNELKIREAEEKLEEEKPDWLGNVTLDVVIAIAVHGCNYYGYMHACEYENANGVMKEYGDEVLEYLEDACDNIPTPKGTPWNGFASFYLTYAADLWCLSFVKHGDYENLELD